MSFTPLNYDAPPTEVTWQARPICNSGPCDVRITSSTGSRYLYKLLPDGRYRWTDESGLRPTGNCLNEDGTTAYENAYIETYRTTLRIVRARGTTALRFKGLAYNWWRAIGPARAEGCDDGTWIARVYAVRRS